MPSIKITKDTKLSPQESYEKVTHLLSNDAQLKKLDPAYECKFNPSDLSGTAQGSQFKANMKIQSAGAGSKIEIQVDLPFHLGLVKGLVQKTLEGKIDQAIG